jgi:hypothetical protein
MLRSAFCIVAAVAVSASAQIVSVTDDLTDGTFDSFFNYDFSADFPGNGPGNDFNSLDNMFGLLLASDEVLITFPGAAGGEVLEVSVNYTDFTGVGATTFEAIGLSGSKLGANTTVSNPEVFGASFTEVGFLTSVNITAFESYVSSVTVRYRIPTPATAGLLGIAGMIATRRRR